MTRFAVVVLALGLLAGEVRAAPVNKTLFGGLAVKGYDVVAYFTEGRPVKGLKDLSYAWGGARWLFATEANRAAFAANPVAYAPQYGGYCAWAVSQGYTADIDPSAWKIVDGKLYLNYNDEVQMKWVEDFPGLIRKGDANWPAIRDR